MKQIVKTTVGDRIRESLRKLLVYIKLNPQLFPKILMALTCCFFTFNLNSYSYAAADISHTMPAVNLFVITLLSFMMIISFVTVKAVLLKKPAPVIITLVFIVAQIVLQIIYLVIMNNEISLYTPQQLVENHPSWALTVVLTYIHLALLFVTLLSIVLMPLYAKLLLKIKTDRADMIDEMEELEGDNIQIETADLTDE